GTLFGLRKGFFTRLLLPYLDYYRPGFHPSDHDTAKLEKYWKDKLAFAD
ncbi:metal-dependent hydrolase, partial [Pseudomonas aeruginosa]